MQLTRRLGLLDAVHACVKEPSDSFNIPGQLEATKVGLAALSTGQSRAICSSCLLAQQAGSTTPWKGVGADLL